MIQIIVFIIQIGLLFFLSKQTINEIFYFLRLFIKTEKYNLIIVSLFFLPGTVLHEFSHFFMAIVLFLRVRELKIFPEFQEQEIKLGHVLYEKKDVVRGVLVGIAPVIGAMFLFWCLAFFQVFPSQIIILNLLLAYLVFTVSSTMFSSKQDLVDLVFIIPFVLLGVVIFYIFDIRLDVLLNNPLINKGFIEILSKINLYFLFSLVLHGFIIVILKLFIKTWKK